MGTCTSTICDEEASSSNAVRAGIVEKVRVLLQLKRQRSILVEKGEEVKYNSNQQEDTTITYDEDSSRGEDPVDLIRQGVVGQRHSIRTPFGQRQLVYADYTASGRFLAPVEEFFTNKIAPLYANTHTEASATGAQTTVLREEARFIVAQNVNAPARKYATLFVGTGCSGAIEKMIKVLGIMLPTYADKKWKLSKRIPEKERPVVFIGPFEHHSNELSWRESLATVVVIPEDKYGCPNMKILEQMLIKYKDRKMKIGSFCAGSNVTGICIDTKKMAILLHKVSGCISMVSYVSCCPCHNEFSSDLLYFVMSSCPFVLVVDSTMLWLSLTSLEAAPTFPSTLMVIEKKNPWMLFLCLRISSLVGLEVPAS